MCFACACVCVYERDIDARNSFVMGSGASNCYDIFIVCFMLNSTVKR